MNEVNRAAALVLSYCRNKLTEKRFSRNITILYPLFGRMFGEDFVYSNMQQFFDDVDADYAPPEAEDSESDVDDLDDMEWAQEVEEAVQELQGLMDEANEDVNIEGL